MKQEIQIINSYHVAFTEIFLWARFGGAALVFLSFSFLFFTNPRYYNLSVSDLQIP
jgi:hypothetical protein